MALAIAPNKRELTREMRWRERDRRLSGKNSLEGIAKQSGHNNPRATNMAYVFILPEISADFSPIPHGMTSAEWESHKQSVNEFNAWYNSRGIDQVVKNTHRNIFGKAFDKVYDAAAHGLSYFGNIAGKDFSLLPERGSLKPLVIIGLAAIFAATAYFAPKCFKGANSINPTPPAATPAPEKPTPDYNLVPSPAPKPTPEPAYTPKPTPTVTPTQQPTPTLEAKLFEFVFPSSTPEQYETFSKNALEDYRTVLKVYGIKEEDAKVRIIVEKTEGYSIDFSFGNKSGGNAWTGFDDFTTDRRGFRHETAHAINHTLFPTKNDVEPWYNTFDEGMAGYASGMNDVAKDKRKIRLKDVDKEGNVNEKSSSIYPVKEAYELLKQNPELYWKRRSGDSPGHATGADLYWFLIEIYDLTPEKNRIVLGTLAEKYSETEKLTRKGIQGAYEIGLGLTKGSLDNLFDLMEHGVRILYSGK